MSSDLTIDRLYDAAVLDSEREAFGNVSQVYTDETGAPSYVEVAHGVFGMGSSLVPLRGASLSGDHLVLAFSKDTIKDTPHHEPGKELVQDREQEILRHYGVTAATESSRGLSRPSHGDRGGRDGRVGDSRADELRDPHGLDQLDDHSGGGVTER